MIVCQKLEDGPRRSPNDCASTPRFAEVESILAEECERLGI
jgi:hypothetical protein